jgi:hypothetical protein
VKKIFEEKKKAYVVIKYFIHEPAWKYSKVLVVWGGGDRCFWMFLLPHLLSWQTYDDDVTFSSPPWIFPSHPHPFSCPHLRTVPPTAADRGKSRFFIRLEHKK